MKTNQWALPALGLLLLAAGSGCAAKQAAGRTDSGEPDNAVRAAIINTKGKTIGSALLTPDKGGVRIRLEVKGLAPGPHGYHIHETGRCEAPGFTTAGAHLNPEGKKHGLQNPEGPHAGDLPNLNVASDGTAKADWIAGGVTLTKGEPNSLLKDGGTSIVIHEAPDDGVTDPSGNSGARVACGAIS